MVVLKFWITSGCRVEDHEGARGQGGGPAKAKESWTHGLQKRLTSIVVDLRKR